MSSEQISVLSAPDIAQQSLHDPAHFKVQLSQTEHRIALVSKWPVFAGAKVLELGCGQGDCTSVLAEVVGPNGHVTAVDPAELTYGAPYTIGQAQTHLSSGKYCDRITWVKEDPIKFLESNETKYDFAVLAHCLWYFSSPHSIVDTLRKLSSHARYICIAEWSLSAGSSGANAAPHVLTVLTQASLECRKPESESNVRTVVSPARIKELAAQVGLTVKSEGYVTPADGVLDGKWEVDVTMDDDFLRSVDEFVKDERERGVILALRDAVATSMAAIGGRKFIRSMDVWCATLELRSQSEAA